MATELREQINNIIEEKNAKILPENIKEGVKIFDVEGTYKGRDTSDATVTTADVLTGKTVYINGEMVEGSMSNLGAVNVLSLEDTEETTQEVGGYVDQIVLPSVKDALLSNVPTVNYLRYGYGGLANVTGTKSVYVNTTKAKMAIALVMRRCPITITQKGWELLSEIKFVGNGATQYLATYCKQMAEGEMPYMTVTQTSAGRTSIVMFAFDQYSDVEVVYNEVVKESSAGNYIPDEVGIKKGDIVAVSVINSFNSALDYRNNIRLYGAEYNGTGDSTNNNRLYGFYLATNPTGQVYVKIKEPSSSMEAGITALRIQGLNPLAAENIRAGVQILDVVGTLEELDTSDANAVAETILVENSAYVNGEKIDGVMANNGELNYTPSEEIQTIPAGYISGGTVQAIDVKSIEGYQLCNQLADSIIGIGGIE